MSQNRKTYTATYEKNAYRNQAYMYGSAAPKRIPEEIPVYPDKKQKQAAPTRRQQVGMPQQPRRQAPNMQPHEVRKNREKALHMSAGYVLFLFAALLASAFILVN